MPQIIRFRGHIQTINSVQIMQVDDQEVIISASADGTVGIQDDV